MMRRSEKTAATPVSGQRSVAKILARRQARRARQRQVLAPDFVHGERELAAIYDDLGASWVERALFVVADQDVVTVAYFDDYFLVIDQWQARGDESLASWWRMHRVRRDRVVRLCVDGKTQGLAGDGEIAIAIGRPRLEELEQGLLGLVRDGCVRGQTVEERMQRGQIDILSLVTMIGELTQ